MPPHNSIGVAPWLLEVVWPPPRAKKKKGFDPKATLIPAIGGGNPWPLRVDATHKGQTYFFKKKTINFFDPWGWFDHPQGPLGGFGHSRSAVYPYAILGWHSYATPSIFLSSFFNFSLFLFLFLFIFKNIIEYCKWACHLSIWWKNWGEVIAF